MIIDPSIFRDYDIRAIANVQLDVEGVKRIAKAIFKFFNPKSIQVGRDMRVTSPEFQNAFIETMLDLGVDVVDLGLVSTDMLYFASGTYDEDLAITLSASHNPPEYNGMKMVKKGAIAVSGDSGIYDIKKIALSDDNLDFIPEKRGVLTKRDIMDGWINHLLKFVDTTKLKDFNIVSDTGNGMAGHFMPHLEEKLPWKVTRLFYDLDGSFPNHVPSPIEEKNRIDCVNKVKELSADMGFVFDGDGDRVFLIDEKGRTLSGTIMTAMIAETLLQKYPNSTILYNAIVGRIVPEIVSKNNGKSERVRVGHTLIKESMRRTNALFCGEHSGHYYFKDNFFADSAIIAALLVAELMSVKNKKLSELYDEYDKYKASPEINFEVSDKNAVMDKIESEFKPNAVTTDRLDGVTVWFNDWWFNVRPSNTEPLLRLNLETNTQEELDQKTKEMIEKIESLGGRLKE